jgi:hypothetical protein
LGWYGKKIMRRTYYYSLIIYIYIFKKKKKKRKGGRDGGIFRATIFTINAILKINGKE